MWKTKCPSCDMFAHVAGCAVAEGEGLAEEYGRVQRKFRKLGVRMTKNMKSNGKFYHGSSRFLQQHWYGNVTLSVEGQPAETMAFQDACDRLNEYLRDGVKFAPIPVVPRVKKVYLEPIHGPRLLTPAESAELFEVCRCGEGLYAEEVRRGHARYPQVRMFCYTCDRTVKWVGPSW